MKYCKYHKITRNSFVFFTIFFPFRKLQIILSNVDWNVFYFLLLMMIETRKAFNDFWWFSTFWLINIFIFFIFVMKLTTIIFFSSLSSTENVRKKKPFQNPLAVLGVFKFYLFIFFFAACIVNDIKKND